jgi:hypothetical protein
MKTQPLAFTVLGCLSFGLCQCSSDEKNPPVGEEMNNLPQGMDEESPAMGVVCTTTHSYTLHAGSDETLYTVMDNSGREIARLLSFAELANRHPTLSEELKSLYAGNQRMDIPASHLIESNSTIRWEEFEIPIAPESRIVLPDLPDLKRVGE